MTPDLRELIGHLLDGHRIMTLATNRPDGWPQATVVGYANEGFTLYCFVARMGQKYSNIIRDPRVSAAIGSDFKDPLDIKALSLAGKATPVTEESEFQRACAIFMKRYPEYAVWPAPNPAVSPMVRITPTVFSVLDYSKGFGHSDFVTVEPETGTGKSAQKHHWFGRFR